jgi:putative RNA 2'-phosphotransferase
MMREPAGITTTGLEQELDMKTQSKALKRTGKFMAYVLGSHPYEFGLLPDKEGFVPVKELLKALHEEDGWRHVRAGLLNELLITVRPAPIEIKGNLIRAVDRSRLPEISVPKNLPKLLYIAIRARAYLSVIEKGLQTGGSPYLILSSDKSMALRIGRRRDNHPVLLSVQVQKTREHNVVYHQFGENLFLTDQIPAGTFTGPAAPKPKPVTSRDESKKVSEPQLEAPTPGSYLVSIDEQVDPKQTARQRRQKQKDRQKARRHERKHKRDRYR